MKPTFVRSLFVSSILVLISIAPAWAQYSFMYTYSTPDDESPYGMLQASNGSFIVYGMIGGSGFLTGLNAWADVLWTLKSSPGNYTSLLELNNNSLVAAGEITDLLQDPQITILNLNGTVLLDTIYKINAPRSGGLTQMVNSEKNEYLVSVGFARVGFLYFQRTNYNGKILWHKDIPYGGDYRFRHLFKHIEREEYLLFGEKHLMRVDSMGNFISGIQSAVDDIERETISDIVQRADGTFIALVRDFISHNHLLFYDESGQRITRRIQLPTDNGFLVLNTTKDNGLIVAGTHLLVLDSQMQTVWKKQFLTRTDTLDIKTIAQADDGGFYGCGMSYAKFETRANDIYAFKTTPEGEILHTGLQESKKQLDVQLTPNPSEGIFTLTGEINNVNVSITNLLGQVVYVAEPLSPNGVFDVSNLKAGVYILTVTGKHETYVRKITIRK